METLWNEFRYCARTFARNPAFTAVCLVTLALGIGVNTAVFSMVNSLLFRPLPVPKAEQMTVFSLRQKHGPRSLSFSLPDVRDIQRQSGDVFSDVMAYQIGLDGLSWNGNAVRISSAFTTGNFFSGLGLKPYLGRFIRPGEGETAGADPVLVLSYRYWRQQFAGDPGVVGRKVLVNGHPVTIIGVAPEDFHGPFSMLQTQGYMPMSMAGIEGMPNDFMDNRAFRNLLVLGRLRPHVGVSKAQAALNVVAARLEREHPDISKALELEVFPELGSRPEPDSGQTVVLICTLFLALSAVVLILACVNVANMLLVRATVRQRELAIRVALGAARGALIRQILTESLSLGLLGSLGGIVLGYAATRALSSLVFATDLSIQLDFGFDWRVLGYAMAAALLSGGFVGLLPALRSSKTELNAVLQQGGRGMVGGRHRLRNALVTVQVAGSLTLLIIAGLFGRSLAAVQHIALGFDADRIALISMDPTEIGYSEADGQEFYRRLLDRVRALPGVEAASLAGSVPMGYIASSDNVKVDGAERMGVHTDPLVSYVVVAPDYFRTMGMRLSGGREFTAADKPDAAYTAVVNEAMAKKLWPGRDAMGREFAMASEPKHQLRIVGVVNNVRGRPSGPMTPLFYVPLAQHYASESLQTLHVRTRGAPEAAIPQIEKTVRALAPQLPLFEVKTLRQALYTLNGLLRFEVGAALAGALGFLGLVLAVVGVYGVISYATTQQTHEIGLRMALGAKPVNVLGMVMHRGLLIVGVGLLFGLVLSVEAAGVVGSLVIINPTDPMTYAVVTALLTLVAMVACYIPAHRAMRVDPMVALRHD